MELSSLSEVSQNNILPRCTPSSVSGLSAGMSMGGKRGGISRLYGVGFHTCSGLPQLQPDTIVPAARTTNSHCDVVRKPILFNQGAKAQAS